MAVSSGIAAVETQAPAPKVEGAPSMKGSVFSIFDNKSGTRTGRIKVEHIDFEYRRQGFMLVALRPQVVMEGVEMEIDASLAWNTQGLQIVRALTSMGKHEEVLMRNIRVRFTGPQAQELTAQFARLTPTGALEFSQAGLTASGESADSDGTYLLPLTGPNAGHLMRTNPRHPSPNRNDLLSNTIAN